MNEIIESKNLMINNLLKDDLYDINRDLYSYIYNIDSSLLENNQKTTFRNRTAQGRAKNESSHTVR